jgi:sulfur relay (sulfurtransferase) complex TusBCD TusD component (DsrE family)
MQIGVFLVGAVLAAVGVAHPGHDVAQEAAERREILLQTRNDLSHCAEKLKARGVHHRNIQRRSKIAEGLMSEQGLQGKFGPLGPSKGKGM